MAMRKLPTSVANALRATAATKNSLTNTYSSRTMSCSFITSVSIKPTRRSGMIGAQCRLFGSSVHQIKTPELGGESITDGTIMEWKFKVGDSIKKGDLIAVIETDKVTVEVLSDTAGVLQKILVPVDATCEPGMPLCDVGSGSAAAPVTSQKGAPAPSAAASPAVGSTATASSIDIKTPELGGESITEGTIMEWKVKKGDSVKKGDLVAVIETDKVTVEVKAEAAGVVTDILVPVDATCEPGMPLCKLSSGEGLATSPSSPTSSPAMPPAQGVSGSGEKVVLKTPEFGAESITEGTIMEWQRKVGDFVKKGQILALIETDKVTVELKAEGDGKLVEIKIPADGTASVGAELCVMELGSVGAEAAPAEVIPANAAPAAPAKTDSPVLPVADEQAADGTRVIRREKMKRMRLTIAKNLKKSQDTMAMLTTFQEVDMSGLITMRKEYKDLFESNHGAKLGFMSPFFKASAHALQQIPSLNAYIDNKTNEIVYRDYVDVSFAAATSRGLVTPVIRDVQNMDLRQIEKRFAELSAKAKADKLDMSEITGSTFTISNGGVFGSMLGTPLIGSTEQSAVLGLHATKPRPVVLKNGEIGVRPLMYIALTYDHRIVDGREAVTFLCTLRDQVEDPRRMLLGC